MLPVASASPVASQPRAYTVARVAALWGVSDTFVYDLCNSGQLPGAFKLGRKLWRIPPASLQEYEDRAASPGPGYAPEPITPPAVAHFGRLTRHSRQRQAGPAFTPAAPVRVPARSI